jgi:uncharacterized protein YndB with AHSA1/START domain
MSDNNAFIYTTYIRSTPEKVWQALTTPEFQRQYWGGRINVTDLKKGSKWEHVDPDKKGTPFLTGEILECTPPKRLAFTWIDSRLKDEPSRVTYDIDTVHDQVRLTITHDGFSKADYTTRSGISTGWPLVIASLKSLLETGKSIDIMAIKTCAAA